MAVQRAITVHRATGIRPAHRFAASPEREVDAALGAGLINIKIPFIRRETVRALRGVYPRQDVALAQIDGAIRESVNGRLPHAFEEADLKQAIGVAQSIYRTNIFPSMKVTWATYPNQMGHTVSTGCFRCHDDGHKTAAGVAIRQDCDLCHEIE